RRLAPQNQSGQTDCGREMRDAGVVANKASAPLQQSREFGERTALGDADPGWGQSGREALQSLTFGLTTNQEQIETRLIDQVLQQFSPFGFGPILVLAATAGVQSENSLVWLAIAKERTFTCGFASDPKVRNGIGIEDCEALERLQIEVRSMKVRPFSGPMRAC